MLLGAASLLLAGCRGLMTADDPGTDGLAAEVAATARAVSGVDLTPRGAPTAPPSTTAAAAPVPVGAVPKPSEPPPPRPSEIPAAPAKPVEAVAAAKPTAVPPAPTRSAPTPTPAIAFPKEKPIVYAAIGASDTVGVGAPNPARDGWVPTLHRRLPAGSKLVNLGISGALLADAVAKELPKAIEAKPDLVTVWNVVNDLNANVDLAAYERDADRLLSDLVTKTSARIVVGNCPDLGRVPAYLKAGIPADALRQEVARWNAVLARAVGKHPARAHLVDLYARSGEIDVDPNLVAGDDFHPSAKGYAEIAQVFWDFMVANRLVAG